MPQTLAGFAQRRRLTCVTIVALLSIVGCGRRLAPAGDTWTSRMPDSPATAEKRQPPESTAAKSQVGCLRTMTQDEYSCYRDCAYARRVDAAAHNVATSNAACVEPDVVYCYVERTRSGGTIRSYLECFLDESVCAERSETSRSDVWGRLSTPCGALRSSEELEAAKDRVPHDEPVKAARTPQADVLCCSAWNDGYNQDVYCSAGSEVEKWMKANPHLYPLGCEPTPTLYCSEKGDPARKRCAPTADECGSDIRLDHELFVDCVPYSSAAELRATIRPAQ